MNLGDAKSDWTGDDEMLDGAAEELLAGRYEGGEPDLVALSQFLRRVRSLGDRPAPPPSAALAEFLGVSRAADQADAPIISEPRRDLVVRTKSTPADVQVVATRPPRRRIRSGTLAAAITALLLAFAVAAGAAGVLPGATQAVAERIVRTVTPFELPDPSEPGPVPSRGPDAGSAGPSDPGTATPGEPPQPGGDGAALDTGESLGPDGGNSGSQPGHRQRTSVAATKPPPQPGPAAPGPVPARPSPAAASVRPPPPTPQPARFRADLSGTSAVLPVGDLDGRGTAVLESHRARQELCLTLVVLGVAPATSAHLHAAPPGTSGPVVAAFTGPQTGTSTACVVVSDQLLDQIEATPEGYYLDVHSLDSPNAALRGQLRPY